MLEIVAIDVGMDAPAGRTVHRGMGPVVQFVVREKIMPTSVRLDAETQTRIRRLARAAGKSRSWVVREAVAAYQPDPAPPKPAEALAPFIGTGNTERRDLSERTGERFAELIQADARARRSR
jgi:hypothetical protein